MLDIVLTVPTHLKIHRSLAEIIQGAVYAHLPPKEHEGYPNPKGRIYKSFCLSTRYVQREGKIHVGFASYFPDHEQALAKAVLFQRFRVGAVECACTEVRVHANTPRAQSDAIDVEGAVVAHVKDPGGRYPIWLEPRHAKFTDMLQNNLRDKYSVLTGETYEGPLTIETQWQSPNRHSRWYKKQKMDFNDARYRITATPEMQAFVLSTGMGAKVAQGFGLVREVGEKYT